MAKPTIVAVHGAWHSDAHFQPLKNNLVSHGYRFLAVLLPSMHHEQLHQPPATSITDDIQAIQAVVSSELEAQPDTDVILLTHSYSGMPGSAAVENLDKTSRQAAGFKNGISALLVISGLLVPAGISGFDWGGGIVPPTIVISHKPSPVDPATQLELSIPNPDPGAVKSLYHDVDDKDAEYYASLLVPQNWIVFRTPVPFAGFTVVPVHFLVCEDDAALDASWQRMIIAGADAERLKANPDASKIVVESLKTSHSPFLSKVQETADWIRRSAGEKI